MIFLDTHVVAWLYHDPDANLPAPVRNLLDRQDLVISPIIELELAYLFEIGRTNHPAASVLSNLADRVGLRVDAAPFQDVMRAAVTQTWTRDPFDRIIVAQAAMYERPLVTRDLTIRAHYPHAVWADR